MLYIIPIVIVLLSVVFLAKSAQEHRVNGPVPTKTSQSPSVSPQITTTAVTNSPGKRLVIKTSEWQYPGSTRIDLGGGNFYYQSSDDPATITAWYKEKIQSLKLNLQTFVTNTVNGNVENKLQASNFASFLSIQIQKKVSESSTKITVKYTVE